MRTSLLHYHLGFTPKRITASLPTPKLAAKFPTHTLLASWPPSDHGSRFQALIAHPVHGGEYVRVAAGAGFSVAAEIDRQGAALSRNLEIVSEPQVAPYDPREGSGGMP